MRDKDDESRIKAYMAEKMQHIKMYNECMNLADGLDVEKFGELVRADERQKIEEQFERRIHRQKNNYGKTMQKLLADEREACAKLADDWPDYNVQGLAEAIRARSDVHASDISQERVGETAKGEHEPRLCCQEYDTCTEPCTPRGMHLAKREWVGFTHEELAWLNEALNLGGRFAVIEAIEAKLREKNAESKR